MSALQGRTVLEILIQFYGPYAFGLISLVIMWFAIVQPELRANRIDHDANAQLVQQMREVSNTMLQTSRILERATDRLGE